MANGVAGESAAPGGVLARFAFDAFAAVDLRIALIEKCEFVIGGEFVIGSCYAMAAGQDDSATSRRTTLPTHEVAAWGQRCWKLEKLRALWPTG